MLVSLLSMIVGIPVLIYILLWLSPVRESLRSATERQLSALLDAEVGVGRLSVEPFSRLVLNDAYVAVAPGDTALTFRELSAGFSLRDLLRSRRFVITDVELMEPVISLRRDSLTAPLNIEPIIHALKGDEERPPVDFDLAVNAVIIRGGRLDYDVADHPEPDLQTTDLNHLHIRGFNADVNAPRIRRDSVNMRLRRLQFYETGGLVLTRLSGDVIYNPERLQVNDLTLRLPQSSIEFSDIDLALNQERYGFIDLRSGSHINLSDFASLLPFDSGVLTEPIELSGRGELFRDSLQLRRFDVRVGELFSARLLGNKFNQTLPQFSLNSTAANLERIIGAIKPLPPKSASMLSRLGSISVKGSASRRRDGALTLNAQLRSEIGDLAVNGRLHNKRLSGAIKSDGLDLGELLPDKELGRAAFDSDFDLGKRSGTADVAVESIEWRGHNYRDIAASGEYRGKKYLVNLCADDSLLCADVEAMADLTPGAFAGKLALNIERLQPDAMGIWDAHPGFVLSGKAFGNFTGPELTYPTGMLTVDGLKFVNYETGESYVEKPLRLTTDFQSDVNTIELRSGPLDLTADGSINIGSLPQSVKRIVASAFPQLMLAQTPDTLSMPNDFRVEATVHEQSPLFDLVSLPVRPLYDAEIKGEIMESADSAFLTLRMPYLQQGKRLLRDTEVNLCAGAAGSFNARTSMDNKAGRQMNFSLSSAIHDGTACSSLDWKVDNDKRFDGAIGLDVKPLPSGADIRIHESEMVFNDALWTINPAYAGVRSGSVIVGNLVIDGPGQQAAIRGVASADSADVLQVRLENLDLDYLFETLALGPAIIFGGTATGTVTGRSLLSPEAILQTSDLKVRDFSYNRCVFGKTDIRADWDPATRAINLFADVDGGPDSRAKVTGAIYPLSQKLDILFNAERLPAGFLHPFLASWADDVGGYASGWARLFGDFVLVDLEGDLFADDFSLKVGYTGVTYHATDSVHIRPGKIELDNIRVSDSHGHTARLDGSLTHDHFIESAFDLRITDAHGLQVIDLPGGQDEMWYGSVSGIGSARIAGRTGLVSISADMQTAPGSDFTFALTSAEQAAEYDFLTFRSASGLSLTDSLERVLKTRLKVNKRMEEVMRRKKLLAETPASFDIRIRMDVTPEARLNLVMDPVAGDKITAYGSGHLDLIYESANDEMRLYGDYNISRGDYNFTLQDIIIKNFSIRDGSVVAFHGDPLGASLNVSAAYQLNANLSDLDDSFLHDKEVQRTNVPVQAVLNLGGDLQNPDISFDLDFPTLTSDVKRKVRSIVSTDEMMNRQIIYLLALNRFYTPDYMAGATKGNELASLASGTISSQLSNILGQLSDKISVAPSVRSDAGDFSDIEFDVALSSTLLNNRLLLNGNFGYRDKTLNNNQFIGDFDAEYLLTRSGNWRLKAYNHFNDRNLYVKTALTTQGLGLVFKHDWGK